LAYQGYGRALDLDLLRRLNALATQDTVPDLTLVLDVPPDHGRLDAARLDRLESEGPCFAARVAGGFRALARQEPERIKIVDGNAAVEAVQGQVFALVQRLLGGK
jgi:dTMP kinase